MKSMKKKRTDEKKKKRGPLGREEKKDRKRGR